MSKVKWHHPWWRLDSWLKLLYISIHKSWVMDKPYALELWCVLVLSKIKINRKFCLAAQCRLQCHWFLLALAFHITIICFTLVCGSKLCLHFLRIFLLFIKFFITRLCTTEYTGMLDGVRQSINRFIHWPWFQLKPWPATWLTCTKKIVWLQSSLQCGQGTKRMHLSSWGLVQNDTI